MGVKETPIAEVENDQEAPADQIEEQNAEDSKKEEENAEDSKKEEEPQILEAKPKRKAKAKPAAKKKETVDLKQRTMCPICKTPVTLGGGMTMV